MAVTCTLSRLTNLVSSYWGWCGLSNYPRGIIAKKDCSFYSLPLLSWERQWQIGGAMFVKEWLFSLQCKCKTFFLVFVVVGKWERGS